MAQLTKQALKLPAFYKQYLVFAPQLRGTNMELLEISEKHKMTREEAAALLHEIADSLARNNELAFERRGIKINIDVPKQVEVEVEVELKSDESSFEIEISW